MYCKNCSEQMVGDGYTGVIHCPNADEYHEPDANPVECEEVQNENK